MVASMLASGVRHIEQGKETTSPALDQLGCAMIEAKRKKKKEREKKTEMGRGSLKGEEGAQY